ncbi:calpastatin [Mycolicibacterium madagascariense]|uniref:Calpastatin n=1 Tax=Mycolicibacterium madagascariense TaxID=212765 RepID=A0A7I7XHM1_9MYCO|nr:DUF1810 domain-containing protein [Mycolicibacterium madagascariense]MCV7016035.1 DUF1810 domain-containing protein [Mycolicibacterium madagascariense]BBZ28698.1 calpastatin [Mycolicibacterium madagascariense]
MADAHDLQRFVDAQDRGGTYDAAVAELRSGRKRSHWMWFVFPQLRGLGRTETATYYGIGSRDEAVAYLAHDVLGPRLRRCAQLVASSGAPTAEQLMGHVDGLKLRSSMTLFAEAAGDVGDAGDFVAVLEKYYGGEPDPMTLRLLGSG